MKRSAGRGSRACPSRTTSATCASSSTSPWPGCSWPAAAVPDAHGTPGAPSAGGGRRWARTGSVIEILVLQALAHQMQGDIAAALVPLERALTLAEPEGYVRIFVDEGPPMAALLEAAAKRQTRPALCPSTPGCLWQAENRTPVKQALIEPLSERELDVLRLLGTDLDGPDIARELMVSLNTMRTHTRNIYSKLGVNNRRAAVRRAEELSAEVGRVRRLVANLRA